MSMDFAAILQGDTGPPSHDFRQILCDHLRVTSLGRGGLQLELFLDDESAVLCHSRQKSMLMPHLDMQEGHQAEALIHRHRSLPAGRSETCRLTSFAFRHASAGVLASLFRGHEDPGHLLLFWRDIHPVGWNVANGASSCDEEFLDIRSLALREAREELLFLDSGANTICPLAGEAAPAEQDEALRLWCAALDAAPGDPVPWSLQAGPDTLITHCNGTRQEISGLVLTVSAADFGIECILGMKISGSPDLVPLDGELLGGRLLNRPVGLFATLNDARRGCAVLTCRGGRPFQETTALTDLCPVTARLLEDKVFSFPHP